MDNIDQNTVSSFGNEWYDFDQSKMSYMEIKKIFDEYFSIFPFYLLTDKSEGFDMGCGSGRWARLMAPKVKKLHCIDPSSAIEVARRNLSDCNNIIFHNYSLSPSGKNLWVVTDIFRYFMMFLFTEHQLP